MKQYKVAFVTFLFISIVFGQEDRFNQTEELDIGMIEEIAKADAKDDFDISKRLTWGVGSATSYFLFLYATFPELDNDPVILVTSGLVLISAPFIVSRSRDVDFPEIRQMEIANESERYRSVYRSKYIPEIKKRRLTYSLVAPAGCVVTELGLFVWYHLTHPIISS